MTTMKYKLTHNCKSCLYRGSVAYRNKHKCSLKKEKFSFGYICRDYCAAIKNQPILKSR